MKFLVAATLMALCTAGPTQAITYDIFRSFDGATVTGTIETDGTLGLITEANVVAWQLNLTSPVPLFGAGGNTTTVSSADQLITTVLGVMATATDLSLADATGRIRLTGASFNGWCLTAAASCAFGAGGYTENLYFSATLETAASASVPEFETFATVAPVPLPTSLPLLLASLGGLGWIAGRRRAQLS